MAEPMSGAVQPDSRKRISSAQIPVIAYWTTTAVLAAECFVGGVMGALQLQPFKGLVTCEKHGHDRRTKPQCGWQRINGAIRLPIEHQGSPSRRHGPSILSGWPSTRRSSASSRGRRAERRQDEESGPDRPSVRMPQIINPGTPWQLWSLHRPAPHRETRHRRHT
jgi:hypothetical protein